VLLAKLSSFDIKFLIGLHFSNYVDCHYAKGREKSTENDTRVREEEN
jgi:hypothetical protein